MYQRAILFLSYQRQQGFDDGTERTVEAEKENGEDDRHDDDHDRSHHRFTAGRPHDLCGLGADLPDEFAWSCFCHGRLVSKSFADSRPAPVKPEFHFADIAKQHV
jgi:hypothetical protein